MPITDVYPLTQSEPFVLKPNEEAREDLTLKKRSDDTATKLTGCVTSGFVPVKNATVKVLDRHYTPVAHTITDAMGVYKFENVLSPGAYKLTAAADGYLTAKTINFTIQNGTCKTIDISLRKDPFADKGIIYGKVSEIFTIQPVEEAFITLAAPNGHTIAETFSNPQGQYLFSSVNPNTYTISVVKNGYCEFSMLVKVEKSSKIKANIVLTPVSEQPSGTVSGIIKDEYQVLEEAVVCLYKMANEDEILVDTVTTNCEGLYLFTNVPEGQYLIKAKLSNGDEYIKTYSI